MSRQKHSLLNIIQKKYAIVFVLSVFLFGCGPAPTVVVPPTPTEESENFVEVVFIEVPDASRPIIGTAENRMAEPVLPENPTQADLGTTVFWLRCMACHGDRGQGLTDEWREAWGPDHMDCWQSKCHASNHPDEGFVLMQFAPNIIHPTALNRFETVQDYYDYISIEMPWWNPGSMPEEEYWQVTAFLLRENGAVITEEITPENAPFLKLGN